MKNSPQPTIDAIAEIKPRCGVNRCFALPLFRSAIALIALGLPRLTQAQTVATHPLTEEGAIVRLEVLEVSEDDDTTGFDRTGMGSFEAEMRDTPFSNDLVDTDDFANDGDDFSMDGELAAIAEPSSAERIAGESRLNLRGFPTPNLSNGFIQIGIPETLNTSQTIVIQGALVPVLGRAAPGGIRNSMTARPRAKNQTRIQASANDRQHLRLGYEHTGTLIEKKLWQRIALDWQRREGPEEFAREDTKLLSTALTWRHSRTVSTMLSLDYRETNAHASPGIPEYRENSSGKIIGPYLPLAYFNANGPHAEIFRRSTTAGLQFDTAPTAHFALRANLEAWQRIINQDRFTNSQFNLDTGLFSGTREPRYLTQPQDAVSAQLEGTLRFQRFGAAHKLLVSVNRTLGEYRRQERALSPDDRNALPLSVRKFDPYQPDYSLPDYSPSVYQRVLTDRLEEGHYTSAEISDRLAFQGGRFVLTTGLRFDQVGQYIADYRPNATRPVTEDVTSQLSYHTGINYQLRPSHLLLFGSVSTAFDPSTPVDARTGRIQDNETTEGYETGVRGRAFANRLAYSVSGVLLYNHHISRRNPLYNDPIADAAQTQPQLVAAGEERFTGTRFEAKWKATETISAQFKGSYLRAITTASPDLPQEVGRPISRLPPFNLNSTIRSQPPGGRSGLTWGAGWQYISSYVANYEDSRREQLEYPGYGIISLNTGYRWQLGKRQLSLDTQLRNALARDLVASHARITSPRELSVTARLTF